MHCAQENTRPSYSMLTSVHFRNRLKVWLVTGSCLTLTLLFLASFNGELDQISQNPVDYSVNVQDESSESKHDLLEDISNVTLGVRLFPYECRRSELTISSFRRCS